MPDPILRAPGDGPTALWLTPGRRLANRCSDLPCDPCGPPPPPPPGTLWVRGLLCACSSSAQDQAWMRASDLADLREGGFAGSCPTGVLFEGGSQSCWEIVAGAEEREFEDPGPPAEQRLTPTGTGGCCGCCADCALVDVPYFSGSGCPAIGQTRLEPSCCPDGAIGVQGGYGRLRTFFAPSFSSCGLAREREMWWSVGDGASTATVRVREYDRTTCALASETVQTFPDRFAPLSCVSRVLYANPLNIALRTGLSELSCLGPRPGCERLSFSQSEGPGGGTLSEVERAIDTDGETCYVSQRFDAVTVRGVARAGPCASRCTHGVLTPAIPLPPGGGDGAGDEGTGLLVPGRAVVVPGSGNGGNSSYRVTGNGGGGDGGCSGCGQDGGL